MPGGREKGGKGAFKGKRELWHTRGAYKGRGRGKCVALEMSMYRGENLQAVENSSPHQTGRKIAMVGKDS